MTYYIEHDFPIEQLNPLSRREANAKRAIAMLHKWWARRVGCVFRTMILAGLIPEEEWRRLEEQGYKVVRYTNEQVHRHLDAVLAEIARQCDILT